MAPAWGPTAGSSAFGPQIDHVLVTGGIATDSLTVHEVPGSDHRAILTGLRLPA